jgi:hypothetical protein
VYIGDVGGGPCSVCWRWTVLRRQGCCEPDACDVCVADDGALQSVQRYAVSCAQIGVAAADTWV